MADASFRATEARLICLAVALLARRCRAKFHHQFWAAASGCARSVLRLVLELDGEVVERADPHIGLRRRVEALVFLPFVDCARKLLKTRLNVTHHQAPIFALPAFVGSRKEPPPAPKDSRRLGHADLVAFGP